MHDSDLHERQALIDDIISSLLDGGHTDMHITIDLEAEVINIAPPESCGIDTDFAHTVECSGTCHMTFAVLMRQSDYDLWRTGTATVQQCLPYISAPFRELLISGLCPACWRGSFGTPVFEEEAESERTGATQEQSLAGPATAEESNSTKQAGRTDLLDRSGQPSRRPLDRIVLLLKGEDVGVLRIREDENRISVVSYDERRQSQPSIREYQNTWQNRHNALAEFRQALELTVDRGWKIGYDGRPLFG